MKKERIFFFDFLGPVNDPAGIPLSCRTQLSPNSLFAVTTQIFSDRTGISLVNMHHTLLLALSNYSAFIASMNSFPAATDDYLERYHPDIS